MKFDNLTHDKVAFVNHLINNLNSPNVMKALTHSERLYSYLTQLQSYLTEKETFDVFTNTDDCILKREHLENLTFIN